MAVKRVWNFFVSFFVAVILLIVAAINVPRLAGLGVYVVTSGSMEPKLPVGSMIYVHDTTPTEIAVGDAITFRMANSDIIATHQVYEIDTQNNQFRTQGINNIGVDGEIIQDAEPVEFDSYIGKVMYCIPYLGYVNMFCTKPAGYFFIMAGVILVVLVSFFIDKIPEKKFEKTEEKKESKDETKNE